MSFAFNASPYNQEPSNDEIERKRQNRNKTIKKKPVMESMQNNSIQNNNVQNMIKTMHSNNDNEDDVNDSSPMGDFNPPPYAQSTVDIKRKFANANENSETSKMPEYKPLGDYKPLEKNQPDFSFTPEGFTNLPSNYAEDYYKRVVPYYNQMSKEPLQNKDELLEKLNYMIHLLEEQKDEKSGHVVEEIILYSFLGIFMIFIVDSFARAGKYVR